MKIEVSDEFQKSVNPKSAWVAIAIVLAFVGCLGAINIITGKLPTFSRTATLVLLNASWAGHFWVMGRKGWRVFPWNQWAGQIGWSLLMCSYVFPGSFVASSNTQMMAALLMGAGILPQILQIRRKKAETVAAVAERVGSTGV